MFPTRRRPSPPPRSSSPLRVQNAPISPAWSPGRARSSVPHLPRSTWGKGSSRAGHGRARRARVPLAKPPRARRPAGLRQGGSRQDPGAGWQSRDTSPARPVPAGTSRTKKRAGKQFQPSSSTASTLCFTPPFHKFNLQTSAFSNCSK